ncbi:MAG TPA: M28 family peptidase [Solirubrobacteraceae bacterium]|nr:M28 family peptidase [Solirubrobacteraceae bacterium]
MLNGRLYRAAFLPFVLVLVVAAFSLAGRVEPLRSSLAPDAFEGQRAYAETLSLAREFPHRRPGSAGDRALAGRVARTLRALGGTAGGGFTVRTHSFSAQTIDGERELQNVIAQRPGSTAAAPIVILAHRDAAGDGARAELSGTAALLELARVFAARETKRTIVLVSTSGGSGGDAGAADFAATHQGPYDAAIVVGDLAGSAQRKPFVVPFSDARGSAPLQLQRTLDDAITREAGADPGAPSAVGQLAHLAFPLTVGEQGPLNAAGIPSVLVQVSGEGGPTAGERVSEQGLESYGRSVLSAIDALDTGRDVPRASETGLLVERKTIPAWALRLLIGTLLLPPLVLAADGLARARRRRLAVARWSLWTLLCAVPFAIAALFAALLGALGIVGAAPPAPIPPKALSFDGAAAASVFAVALVLALAWLLWPIALRRLGVRPRPESDAAGVGALLVLLALAVVVWIANPLAALLLVPALHVWLLIVSPELRPRPPLALALVLAGLLPALLLVAFYADQLGLGPGRVAWMAVLLLAGGHVGAPAALMWSIALGCAAAAVMLSVTVGGPPPAGAREEDFEEITIRGPLTYAGPGSLGGTRSALRR